ncbi:MAG: HesA/MoeB/ThiF family protein [Candidatus Syntropharchaeia archaeon]
MEKGLSAREKERYDRQIMIFGEEAQKKLKKAKVFVAGLGGLGSPISIYLTVAGVGNIRIVDCDVVERSNLNRQILHWEKDIGSMKSKSAEEKLREMNPDVNIEAFHEEINEDTVFELVGDSEIIVDAMDNFEARYLLNKVAIERRIPLVHGAVYGFEGRITTIIPGETPCLRCIYPRAPPASKFPAIGTAPGVIGVIEANEVIKLITGVGEVLKGALLIWDGLDSSFERVRIERKEDCKECCNL